MKQSNGPSRAQVATWSTLEDRAPAYALGSGVDLVVVRYGDDVSVLYGRCLHRGALLADGSVEGANLICGVHGWDYHYDTGISEYNNEEVLQKFDAWVDADQERMEWPSPTPLCGPLDAWACGPVIPTTVRLGSRPRKKD